MKEIPLLFSGDMVRAERAGQKSVTRRVAMMRVCGGKRIPVPADDDAEWVKRVADQQYGHAGDRIWVRESWRVSKKHDGTKASALPFDRGLTIMYDAGGSRARDGSGQYVNDDGWPNTLPDWAGKLRPSIFLPRAACRTLLDIVSVRVERLHDITDDDAIKEGVDRTNTSIPGYARERFSRLWENLNAARGFGWDTNPWVWRIEFKRAADAMAALPLQIEKKVA